MCRDKPTCTELPSDRAAWDLGCPLPTPEWWASQVDILAQAFNEFRGGRREECLETLARLRNDEMRDWYIEHGQMSGTHRARALSVSPPTKLPKDELDGRRSPRKFQKEVFIRDGYRCRYCGNRVVCPDTLKRFIRDLSHPHLKKGDTNLSTSGIIHAVWPMADHVVPWSYGGRTAPENLVTSCFPCNYGKANFTIEQLGIESPFRREPMVDEWTGLVEI
jgi:hypothetical protein|tara:strand:+ start:281 stop:940 length:660 start_codon:yes stop_codon:yes gene_type:complete